MTYSAPKAIALASLALAVLLATPHLIHRPATSVSATGAETPAPRRAHGRKRSAASTLPAVAWLPHQHTAPATARPTAGLSPWITLLPYAARPGQSVDVHGWGFASDEAVRLMVGSALVGHTRAGVDGTLELHAAYTVPDTARPGFLSLAVVGEQSRRAAWQRLYVVPLWPWATASAYVVHPSDRVRFELHGFAAGEVITVQEGATYVGRTTVPTDTDGHVAGVGPFTVPTGSRFPTYTFVGTRSGARLRVTLTVPQA